MIRALAAAGKNTNIVTGDMHKRKGSPYRFPEDTRPYLRPGVSVKPWLFLPFCGELCQNISRKMSDSAEPVMPGSVGNG